MIGTYMAKINLFEKLMEVEEYRKLFDKFPDDQKPILIDRVKTFLEKAERELINPLNDLAEQVKKERSDYDRKQNPNVPDTKNSKP